MDQKKEEELIAQFAELTIDQVNEKEIPKEEKEIEKPQEKTQEQTQEQTKEVTLIKGTQRPDGSFRKDIKIRAGFKNVEMMGKYVVPQKR